MLGGKRSQNVKTVAILGLIAGVLNANPISIVLEIIALVFIGNAEVIDWLAGDADADADVEA